MLMIEAQSAILHGVALFVRGLWGLPTVGYITPIGYTNWYTILLILPTMSDFAFWNIV